MAQSLILDAGALQSLLLPSFSPDELLGRQFGVRGAAGYELEEEKSAPRTWAEGVLTPARPQISDTSDIESDTSDFFGVRPT